MSAEKILSDWKKKLFKPIYWLEGEEEYAIDKVINYAEKKILTEAESSFNLSIFYGKDANWPDIVNACRRYPVNTEKQVVLLKEAQHMKEYEKLESYMEKPSSTTIFVVSYKDKKLDARKKFTKFVKSNGELLTTKKMYDNKLPEWTQELIQSKNLSITAKGLVLIVNHIGNDLVRIDNEIEKLAINLGKRTQITEDDIEKYIGVSKEYNFFELQSALAKKDLVKCLPIIQYFASNSKAHPIQMILPALYGFFSKVFVAFSAGTTEEKTLAAHIGISPWAVKDYQAAVKYYNYAEAEKALLLLHQYNLKTLGVGHIGNDESLLKELIVKIIN